MSGPVERKLFGVAAAGFGWGAAAQLAAKPASNSGETIRANDAMRPSLSTETSAAERKFLRACGAQDLRLRVTYKALTGSVGRAAIGR